METLFNIFPCGAMSIVRIFGSEDPLYNEFSVKCLRIFLMLIFLDSFQIVVQIPALLILGKVFGIDGLLYAGALSSLLVGLLSIVFLVQEWKALEEKTF